MNALHASLLDLIKNGKNCCYIEDNDINYALHKYQNLFELFMNYNVNPHIKNMWNKSIIDRIEDWLTQSCPTYIYHTYYYEDQQKYKILADYVFSALNKKIGKQMLAIMTTGYFLVIPRDIKEYIAQFNYDYPEI